MSIKSTYLMIIAMCVVCTFAQAQQGAGAAEKTAKFQDASTSCYESFNTALPNFCVTQNGNIADFIYPTGFSQIFTDGYGVCDYTSSVSYYDVAVQDSGNWQAAVVNEAAGANILPLTVTRTSSDGVWTITQVFNRSTADAYVKVQMTLKNNTGVGRVVSLTRYVDVDADASPGGNYFDGSINAGWGYKSAAVSYPNHGLMVRANQSVHNYFGYNTASGNYDPCNMNVNQIGIPTYGDEAIVYEFSPNGTFSIPGKKSITVTLEYRPM